MCCHRCFHSEKGGKYIPLTPSPFSLNSCAVEICSGTFRLHIELRSPFTDDSETYPNQPIDFPAPSCLFPSSPLSVRKKMSSLFCLLSVRGHAIASRLNCSQCVVSQTVSLLQTAPPANKRTHLMLGVDPATVLLALDESVVRLKGVCVCVCVCEGEL